MILFEARPVTVSIARPAAEVYAFAHPPQAFAKWAAGLVAGLTRDGDRWIAQGPDGDVQVRFTPENAHGVLDHWVTLVDGTEIGIPLRVVANGEGAEVTLTLFRLPDMDAAAFARDQAMVAKDLATLKGLLES